MNNKNKVLVIGLDGVTFDLILDWINENKLPFLNKLLKNGVHAELKSTIPMFTPTAWTSFSTGMNPGGHGITGFFKRKENSYDVTLSNMIKNQDQGKKIWNILSENEKKVIVMNIPLTYPPEKVNGFMISGMMTPTNSNNFTFPSSLKYEILNNINNYRINPLNVYEEGKEIDFISELSQLVEIRTKTALYLMNQIDWDFFMVVFNETDYIQHAFWKYIDMNHPQHDQEKSNKYVKELLSFYQRIDNKINEIVNCSGENTTIVIMSDHGFGSLYKFIHVNNWLLKMGLIKLKRNVITQTKYLLHRLQITPNNIYKILLKLNFGNIRLKMGKKKGRKMLEHFFLSFSDVDWKRTKAYSLGAMGQIFINVKGREPLGIVNKNEEYEELRNFIIHKLSNLSDPDTYMPVVEKIYKKEEIYSGSYYEKMPDIVFIPCHGYIGFEEFEFSSNSVFSSPKGISGTHRPNGILIMSGTNVKNGKKLSNSIKIEDVAPTILKLFNISIPDKMDGAVILEAFKNRQI
ncbi:hypothetical protein MCGE09_00468 [Thaumarchaeota archaeon SCGC AB-539-E09]|nr:hypothetical protein MCGE09_00468 [Thaumarchaeota archaeon SCGC AB-539-E09]